MRAAGPLDDRIPQESVVYVGWAGSEALQGQYANSNLKGVVDASSARKFIAEQLPKLIEQAGGRDPAAAAKIAMLKTVLGVVWKHPTAFYFCPMEFANPGRPEFRFGLVCDAGEDGKAVLDLINEMLAQNPPPPDMPIRAAQEGTLVSMTFGKADMAEDRRRGGGLAAAPSYVKAMNHVKTANAAFAVYVDVAQLVAMVNDGIAKTPGPPEMKAHVPVVIDALGLNSFTQIAVTSGFDGKGWSKQAFIGVSGPHKGVLTLFADQPVSDGALAIVPKDAAMFAVGKVDLEKIFAEARSAMGSIDEGMRRQFDEGLARASQQIGLNIEQDFIAPLGDEWIIYRAPNEDVGGYSVALVQKVRDGDRLAKTIAAVEGMINDKAQGRFKIDKTTVSKMEVSSVSFLQYSAAWTVRNGYLYVSSLDGIAGAVKQVENKLPSIVENEMYKAAMARLPQGIKPTSISYSNPAKLYPELRRTLLGLLPLARAAGVDLPGDLLPDTADITPFLTPGAQVTWWDAEGLHGMRREAFPGVQIIGGNPSGMSVAALAAGGLAVALPATAKARTNAQRVVDATDLRAIVQGCAVYAASNNDNLPDDLAKLVAEDMLPPRALVSPLTENKPLEMTPGLSQLAKADPVKFSETVAAHCDFIYLGKGTRMVNMRAASSMVLAYTKPSPKSSEGINLAFYDGHIAYYRLGELDEAFRQTNTYRQGQGLPPVDVQDIIRQCRGGMPAAPTPSPATAPAGRGRP
jgi:hypothetical protein